MRVLVSILAVVLAACSGAPISPLATVAPTPFVTPQPAPTLAPVGGSGAITFGVASALNEDTLEISPSKSSFKVTNKGIAWSAELLEPAGATSLTWILAKVSASGTERIIWREETNVSNPTFDLLANSADLALLVDRKPGTYVMRYLRDSTILAEGQFTLVK